MLLKKVLKNCHGIDLRKTPLNYNLEFIVLAITVLYGGTLGCSPLPPGFKVRGINNGSAYWLGPGWS